MKYILVLFMFAEPPLQIGPFGNVFACEQAAVQLMHARGHSTSVNRKHRAVCVNLDAKPHHWNGKTLKK